MKMMWVNHGDNICPSCLALNGQVHEAEDWTIEPKDHRLYCRESCKCTMEHAENVEIRGDMKNVPLRQERREDGSGAPLRSALITGDTPEPPGGTMQDIEYTLSATATPTETGFDILAINEGEAKGHGITFSRAVLQDAMPLYDGIPVFLDHAAGNAQSVRNLAGTLHTPSWNEREAGIQLKLVPGGPGAAVLMDLRDAAKKNPAIMKAVGFSSVIHVQLNKQREVTKITRARSTDVVIDPARGGKFLSALEHSQAQTEETMSEQTHEAEAKLQETAAQVKALQTALLDQTLKASGLPEASQKAVKKSLSAVDITAEVIDTAIREKREELAEVGKGQIQGPSRSRVTDMVNSEDQFRLAVSDLMGLERDENEKNVRVHRLSGIREAYLMATGDQDFMGGYHGEFALVTANFPGILANIQNKMLLKAWDRLRPVYGWWERIVTVEHFTSLNDIAWLKTGTIASLPTVAERGEYTELTIGDNKETSTWEKFGGYVPLTLEAVLRDDVRAFRRMPHELALAGMRNISEQVAEIFTSASGAGPTLADTGALFNSTAVTTAGGHANLLTTAIGTDFVAWDAIASAVYNQPLLVKNEAGHYGTGKKMGIEPRYILVPRALKAQAEALFIPRLADVLQTAGIASKGQPSYGGGVEPITVPEWTDATDYAAVVDPQLVPGVMIGEIFGVKPQIFSASSEIDPAMFANDESRIKVRQLLAVGVADFRPLHKSNVAG
jgi:hypothetical protein